jgi:tetratricopeptide (TPR) repeat protein
MRTLIKILGGGLSLALSVPSAAASIRFYDAAATSFPTLAVPVGIRAIGMGGAYTAVGNDVYALNWDPAGLAKLSGYQMGLADNQWSPELGMRQEVLAYGQDLGPGSGLGVSVNYFGLGQLERRDGSGALQGQSNAYLLSGTLGYAWSMLARQKLRLGLALEGAGQSLFDSLQTALDGSAGLIYDVDPSLAVAASVNHLGIGAPGYGTPWSASAGVAWQVFGRRLTLALDGQMPDKAQPQLKAGAELRLGVLSLRGGYRQALGAASADVQSGLAAGAGFKAGVVLVDYAFVSYGDLSNVHRMGITLDLPRNFFRATVVGAEGSVEMARIYFDKASDLENSGETLKALIEYQRSVESYPEKERAAPQKFYADAKAKVDALQAEMNKQGDGGQVKNLVKERLVKAQEHLKARRFREATEELLEAQKIDPTNAVVQAQMAEAKQGLEQSLLSFRSAARSAAGQNRLAVAVENYKKILAQDPADAESLGYLSKHRKDLEALLQDVHRKGIFEYVGGRLQAAVAIWENGEALDYFGDVGFRRDIDKAKKRIGLHGGK